MSEKEILDGVFYCLVGILAASCLWLIFSVVSAVWS
jgi:hypothetical protein